jgi:SOS-response transcriptional repressor LexA
MLNTELDMKRLGQLRDYYARHGALPSYSGISAVVGFRAKTAAVKLAERLAKAGYLRQSPGGRLSPAARFFGVPMIDSPVRAGKAEAIDAQDAAELVTLDSFLIAVPSKTVLVRVKGDSMRDAGVLDGDLAVVERAETAGVGQFVVAVVDGEFTMKELRMIDATPVLWAHNPEFAPITPTDSLEIFGIVRGVVRRYGDRAVPVRLKAGDST